MFLCVATESNTYVAIESNTTRYHCWTRVVLSYRATNHESGSHTKYGECDPTHIWNQTMYLSSQKKSRMEENLHYSSN